MFLLGVAVASRISRAGREAEVDHVLDRVARRIWAVVIGVALIGLVLLAIALIVSGCATPELPTDRRG